MRIDLDKIKKDNNYLLECKKYFHENGYLISNVKDISLINEINDNEKSIILVCETGGSSPNAGETLKKEGYKDIYILRGGINQWKMDNLPLV